MKILKRTTIVSAALCFALLVKCFVNIASLNSSYGIFSNNDNQFVSLLAFGVFIVLLGLILLPMIIKGAKLSKSDELNFSKIVKVGIINITIAIIEIVLFSILNENGIFLFLVNNSKLDVMAARIMAESYRILRENFIFINIISLIDGIITVGVAIHNKKVK